MSSRRHFYSDPGRIRRHIPIFVLFLGATLLVASGAAHAQTPSPSFDMSEICKSQVPDKYTVLLDDYVSRRKTESKVIKGIRQVRVIYPKNPKAWASIEKDEMQCRKSAESCAGGGANCDAAKDQCMALGCVSVVTICRSKPQAAVCNWMQTLCYNVKAVTKGAQKYFEPMLELRKLHAQLGNPYYEMVRKIHLIRCDGLEPSSSDLATAAKLAERRSKVSRELGAYWARSLVLQAFADELMRKIALQHQGGSGPGDGTTDSVAIADGAGHREEDRYPDKDKPLPQTPVKENAEQIEGAKGDWDILFRYFPDTTKEDWISHGPKLKAYLERKDAREGYQGVISGARETHEAAGTATIQLLAGAAGNDVRAVMNGALNAVEAADGMIVFAQGVNKLTPVYSEQRIQSAIEASKEMKRQYTVIANSLDLAEKGIGFLKSNEVTEVAPKNLTAVNSVLKHTGTALNAAHHILAVRDAIENADTEPEKIQGLMANAATTAASATFFKNAGAGLREASRGLLGQGAKLPINGPQWALLSSMETEKAKLGRSVTNTLNNMKDLMDGKAGAREKMLKEAQNARNLAKSFMQNSFKGAAKGAGDSTIGELPVIGGFYKTVVAWFSGPEKSDARKRRTRERTVAHGILSGRARSR